MWRSHARSWWRCKLRLATVVAIRFEPLIQDFYQRLLSKSKPYKVAVTACMRKLLTVLNTRMRDYFSETVSKRLDLSFGIFARLGEKYSCYTSVLKFVPPQVGWHAVGREADYGLLLFNNKLQMLIHQSQYIFFINFCDLF